MTAPTRHQPAGSSPIRFRPRNVMAPACRPQSTVQAVVDGPTKAQKRRAMFAAVVVTALAMARPSPLDERPEPPVTPSNPVAAPTS